MRRRDFLKAFAALPLVGPLVASAERPAKAILATTDSSRYRGYPKHSIGYHQRMHAGIQRFDNCLRDGDTTEIPPEWVEGIFDLLCHSDEGVTAERTGTVVTFRVPGGGPASVVLETRWLSDKWPV